MVQKRLLIIDDLLATGGTAIATLDLVDMFNDKEIIGAGLLSTCQVYTEKKLKERGA